MNVLVAAGAEAYEVFFGIGTQQTLQYYKRISENGPLLALILNGFGGGIPNKE
jgi:hypothetical protein